MDIRIEKTITEFYELEDMCWSGALDTLADISRADKEDEFMNFLECIYDSEVTDTEINDFIWFERGYIYESLGLDENGEIPTETERIDIDDVNYSAYRDFDEFCNDMDCDECPFGDLASACEDLFDDYKLGRTE